MEKSSTYIVLKGTVILLTLFLSFTLTGQLPTRLKLKQLEQGLEGQIIVVDSSGNATYGNGVTDGNGIFSGSGSVKPGTLATLLEDTNGDSMDFAIGVFPNWPNISLSGGAGATFWVKESGSNTNTGWVAK